MTLLDRTDQLDPNAKALIHIIEVIDQTRDLQDLLDTTIKALEEANEPALAQGYRAAKTALDEWAKKGIWGQV